MTTRMTDVVLPPTFEQTASADSKPSFDPAYVRDISEKVYRARLDDMSGGGPGAVERMIAKDKDDGKKLRNRAGMYDPITRAYLDALGFKP